MKLPRALLIACLGAAPLCAQQAEPKPEASKPVATPGDAGATGGMKTDRPAPTDPSGHRHGHGQGMPQPEKKPVAYIGLLTREVPSELRAHFSLAEGFGLLVSEVLPDSPAKAAGLKVYDVLVKFEDQQLVNMDQFMALVRAKKKGDVVQMDVITGGKATKVSITLGEHLVAVHDRDPRPHHGGFAGGMLHHGQPTPHEQFRAHEQPRMLQHQNDQLHEQFERLRNLQQELREYQQRVQEWSKGGSIGPIPPAPMLKLPGHGKDPQSHGGGHPHNGHQPQTGISIPPGTDLQRFNFSHSAAHVTRRDDSGEYTLKNENGKKTFIVRPKNAQEKSWPINTDAERQAVPQEFRDKLRMMDESSSGVRIEINPGPAGNPPGSPPPARGGNNAPALPSAKAQTTSA